MKRFGTALLALCALSSVANAATDYPSYMDASSPAARRGYDWLTKTVVPVSGFIGQLTDKEFDMYYLVWPEKLRTQVEKETDPTKRQALIRRLGFQRYGYHESPAQKGTAVGYLPDAQGNWDFTCVACHAGTTPTGELYVGAPNRQLNLQTAMEDRVTFLMAVYPNLPPEVQEAILPAAKKAIIDQDLQFVQMLDPKFERSLNQNRGTTDVWYQGVLNFAVRDQQMNPLPIPGIMANVQSYLLGKVKAVDVDPKPWWHLAVKGKTHLYIDGWLPATGKSAEIAGLPIEDTASPTGILTAEKVKEMEKTGYQDAMAFMRSLKAPKHKDKFPNWITKVKVLHARKAGAKVFAANCAGCHGTYDEKGVNLTYPNRWVKQERIGTDAERLNSTLPAELRDYVAGGWFNENNSVNGAEGVITDASRGYVAPPLTGVWASAPYFHNGAVPTLRAVLYPETRPALWRVDESAGYDEANAGLKVVSGELAKAELDAALSEAAAEEAKYGLPPGFRQNQARREYFDATRPQGKSTKGHEAQFKNLSDADKENVLQYLKTL